MGEQPAKPLLRKNVRRKTFRVGKKVAVSGFYEAHDKHQIELKFNFKLTKEDRESDILVETYLFAPKKLSFYQHSHKATDYFPEITSHVRYDVIAMALDDLVDPENTLSPLCRIREKLDTGKSKSCHYDDSKVFSYELKIFTCIFKESIKARFQAISNMSDDLEAQNVDYAELVNQMKIFYRSVLSVEDTFYGLASRFYGNQFVKESDIESLEGVKEFFYFELNYFYLEIIRRLQHTEEQFSDALKLRLDISTHYQELLKNWTQMGYVVLNDSSENKSREKFIYRHSKLKKFVSAVLFINREVAYNKKSEELLFGVAAGVAMTFAVVVAVITAYYYEINSAPWILSAVFAYIIKDRMKAWMQVRFQKMLPIYLANRTGKLIDDRAGNVGQLKEWLSFSHFDSLPEDVRNVRKFNRELSGSSQKEEDVLYYRKRIYIDHKKIRHSHQRVENIINIFRFNVFRFCQQMDDPVRNLRYLNEYGVVGVYEGKKVYHLNLIVKVTNLKDKNKLTENNKLNLRLILSRDGIERIESPFGLNVDDYLEDLWAGRGD